MAEEQAFRVYLADAVFLQANEKMWTQRFSEMLKNRRTKRQEKSADEIALDVFTKCGLTLEGD